MSSIALALKYRPTCFSDLIGQHAISQTLSLALDSKHISHAYLFSGLRGSGKTSSARIFARALQCESGPTSTPCGSCASCEAALNNRHMDIIEMDAASSRGIDDIKRVIEQTKYRPSFGRYKIFIIDEVHMLSKEAFNALLKTLEEPPELVKFILATTDPLKLPATILSRTQHFRFKQIPHRLVVEHISNILNKEGVSYEAQALDIIARSGAGSLRDTLTLLDQAIIFCKNHIEVAGVTDMLGVVDPQVLGGFFEAILAKDEAKWQNTLHILSEYECEMILDEMMLFLKDKLLSRDMSFPPLLIERFSRIVSDSKVLLNLNTDGAFVLLLCAMKMQEAMKVKDIESMIEELENELFGHKVAQTQAPQAPSPQAYNQIQNLASHIPAQPSSTSASIALHQAMQGVSVPTPPSPAPTPPTPSVSAPASSPLSSAQVLTPQAKFSTLIAKIKDRNLELGDIFEQNVAFVALEDDTLKWHSKAQGEAKERLKEHFKIIKALVGDIFGTQVKIESSHISESSLETTQKPTQEASQGLNQEISQTINQEAGQNTPLAPLNLENVSESSLDSEQLAQANLTQSSPQSSPTQSPSQPSRADSQMAFMAQNKELIHAISQSVGIKEVITHNGDNA